MLTLRRVYAIYNRNRIILYGLSASLLFQTIAGLWEYTVRGARRESRVLRIRTQSLTGANASAAPDPLDNYEYHCKSVLGSHLARTFTEL
jgi:hypothetical protein